jgi:hypothetical protein
MECDSVKLSAALPLHQEEGGANVDGEEVVEILDCGVVDRHGIGDKDVEPSPDDAAHLFRQFVRTVRCREVGRHRLGAAAGVTDLLDDAWMERNAREIATSLRFSR